MKTELNFKTYDSDKKRIYTDVDSDGNAVITITHSVDCECECYVTGYKNFFEMTEAEKAKAEETAVKKTLKKMCTLFKNNEHFETVKTIIDYALNGDMGCYNEIKNGGNAYEVELNIDSEYINCYVRISEIYADEEARTEEALTEAEKIIEEAETTAEAEQAEEQATTEEQTEEAKEQDHTTAAEEEAEQAEAEQPTVKNRSEKAMKNNINSVAIDNNNSKIYVEYNSGKNRIYNSIEEAAATVRNYIASAAAVGIGIDYKHCTTVNSSFYYYATEEEAEQAEEQAEEEKAEARKTAAFYNKHRNLSGDYAYTWHDFYNNHDLMIYITVDSGKTATEAATEYLTNWINRRTETEQRKAEIEQRKQAATEAKAKADFLKQALKEATTAEEAAVIEEQAKAEEKAALNNEFYNIAFRFEEIATEAAEATADFVKATATAEEAAVIAINDRIEEAEIILQSEIIDYDLRINIEKDIEALKATAEAIKADAEQATAAEQETTEEAETVTEEQTEEATTEEAETEEQPTAAADAEEQAEQETEEAAEAAAEQTEERVTIEEAKAKAKAEKAEAKQDYKKQNSRSNSGFFETVKNIAMMILIIFCIGGGCYFTINWINTEQATAAAAEQAEEETKAEYKKYLLSLNASDILKIILNTADAEQTTAAAEYRNRINYYTSLEYNCYHEKYIEEAKELIKAQNELINLMEKQIAINQIYIDYNSID